MPATSPRFLCEAGTWRAARADLGLTERCRRYSHRANLFRLCSLLVLLVLLCGDVHRNLGPPLQLVQWNIHSLAFGKISSLEQMSAHIIALQEIHVSQSRARTLRVAGFDVHTLCRDARGGGVATLVRQNCGLRAERVRLDRDDLETVVLRLFIGDFSFYVVNCYLRPLSDIGEALVELLNSTSDIPCVLCGDFNLHHPAWDPTMETLPRLPAMTFMNEVDNRGFALCNAPGLVTFDNGRSRTIIDLTFSRDVPVTNWSTRVSPDSDHHQLHCTLPLDVAPMTDTRHSRSFYAWRKADWAMYQQKVSASLPPFEFNDVNAAVRVFNRVVLAAISTTCPRGRHPPTSRAWPPEVVDVDERASRLKERFLAHPSVANEAAYQSARDERLTAIRTHLRRRFQHRIDKLNPGESLSWTFISSCSSPSAPFLSNTLLRFDGRLCTTDISVADCLAKTLVPGRKLRSLPRYAASPHPLPFPVHRATNTTRIQPVPVPDSLPLLPARRHPPLVAQQALGHFSCRWRARYNTLPRALFHAAPTPLLLSRQVHLQRTTPARAPGYSSGSRPLSYVGLGALDRMPGLDRRWESPLWVRAALGFAPATTTADLDAPFCAAELQAAVYRLEHSRAPGPDQLHNEMLMNLPKAGFDFLLQIVNLSWRTGTPPGEWKKATIFPLLKAGKPPELPSSYRPISLTSAACKLMERMVMTRFLHVWSPHPNQHAFRRLRSTVMPLAQIADTVERNRSDYYETYVDKRVVTPAAADPRPAEALSTTSDSPGDDRLLAGLRLAGPLRSRQPARALHMGSQLPAVVEELPGEPIQPSPCRLEAQLWQKAGHGSSAGVCCWSPAVSPVRESPPRHPRGHTRRPCTDVCR